jgi:hypothetical protein
VAPGRFLRSRHGKVSYWHIAAIASDGPWMGGERVCVCAKARRELRDQPRGGSVDKARVIAEAWTCERLSCVDRVAVNSVICVPTDRKGRRDPIFDASFRTPVNTRKPGIFTGPHACDRANPRGGQRRRWRAPIGASGSATCGGSLSPSSDRNRAHSPQTVIFWPSTMIRYPAFGLAPSWN